VKPLREKEMAAIAAVSLIEDGMVVGLGTGRTAEIALRHLGTRIQEGLRIRGVPTSKATEALARTLSIPVVPLETVSRVDLTIDGADEVDPQLNLIKGGGGAHFREKVVARASKREVIIVDSGKLVRRLGERFAVPVEVHPLAWRVAANALTELGSIPVLREQGAAPFVTDNGFHILDCKFDGIDDPARLEKEINNVPGVLENGLFIGLASLVLVGEGESVRQMLPP